MLAALGIATMGFKVTYVRCDPDGLNGSHMMPYFLDGVDAVLGSVTRRSDDGRSGPEHAGAGPPPLGCGEFLLLDAPMPEADSSGGFDDDALVAFVTRSHLLSPRRVPGGAKALHLGYDGVGRGGVRQTWDDYLGGRRLAVPALTAAEMASLLHGVPLVRARALARTLAFEVREAAERDGSLRGFVWPSASRRSPGRRERVLKAALPFR